MGLLLDGLRQLLVSGQSCRYFTERLRYQAQIEEPRLIPTSLSSTILPFQLSSGEEGPDEPGGHTPLRPRTHQSRKLWTHASDKARQAEYREEVGLRYSNSCVRGDQLLFRLSQVGATLHQSRG